MCTRSAIFSEFQGDLQAFSSNLPIHLACKYLGIGWPCIINYVNAHQQLSADQLQLLPPPTFGRAHNGARASHGEV